jgi:hypothetical protein
VPLTNLQRRVVRVLRQFREEHTYVAGGAALNKQWPRMSDDMDIFQDRRDQLLAQIEPELQALRDADFSVEITTQDQSMVEAIVREYGFETRVQWLDDPETCLRFFPAIADEEFGFRLHQADNAVNKVLCASRRREARDAVDIATIAEQYAPLGPLVWAAIGKDKGVNPQQMLRSIRDRVRGFSDEEIRAVRMDSGHTVSRDKILKIVEPALDAAYRYCEEEAPLEWIGHLFVDGEDCPIEANADMLSKGVAKAIPTSDFTTMPTIGAQTAPIPED